MVFGWWTDCPAHFSAQSDLDGATSLSSSGAAFEYKEKPTECDRDAMGFRRTTDHIHESGYASDLFSRVVAFLVCEGCVPRPGPGSETTCSRWSGLLYRPYNTDCVERAHILSAAGVLDAFRRWLSGHGRMVQRCSAAVAQAALRLSVCHQWNPARATRDPAAA